MGARWRTTTDCPAPQAALRWGKAVMNDKKTSGSQGWGLGPVSLRFLRMPISGASSSTQS